MTETPDPVTAVGGAFKSAIAAMRRMRGREGRGELREAQSWLLSWLRDSSPISASELATAADLSAASTTEMLDGLERLGLVTRERSQTDRRVVLTSLTDRGRELMEARRAEYDARLRQSLAGFSESELRTAAAVLIALQRMFDQRAEEAVPDR